MPAANPQCHRIRGIDREVLVLIREIDFTLESAVDSGEGFSPSPRSYEQSSPFVIMASTRSLRMTVFLCDVTELLDPCGKFWSIDRRSEPPANIVAEPRFPVFMK